MWPQSAETRKEEVVTKESRDLERDRRLLFQHFPGVPRTDADEILDHEFENDIGRIRSTTDVNEDLGIDLTVTSHIRHKFIDCDDHWTQIFEGAGLVRTREEIQVMVHDRVHSIAASWRVVDRDEDITTSSYVRRSTRWATKNPEPLQTLRNAERQTRKDSNTHKIRKIRAIKSAKIRDLNLERAIEGMSLNSKPKSKGASTTSLRGRIEKLTLRADKAAERRIALGKGNFPEPGEISRLRVIESLRLQEKAGDEHPIIIPSANLITNYFSNNDGRSTINPIHQNINTAAPNPVEVALSHFGRSQERKDPMLEYLNNLKRDPNIDLDDMRLLASLRLMTKLGCNESSLGSVVEMRYLGAQNRRKIRFGARKAKNRQVNKARIVSAEAVDSTTLIDVSESKSASELGSEAWNDYGMGKEDLKDLKSLIAKTKPVDKDSACTKVEWTGTLPFHGKA